MLRFREIEDEDVPSLFAVRIATRENAYTMDQLRELGITVESVGAMLGKTHRGWLCEDEGQVVGFAMGNRQHGEIWVIAVLPECEGRGIGARLLTLVEDWLWSEGWEVLWLTTDLDVSLRAYGFYRRQGWVDREGGDGLRWMQKTRPLNPAG